MRKILGALIGAVIVPLFLGGGPLALGWVDGRTGLVLAGGAVPVGLVLGWRRPRLFLFFLTEALLEIDD